MKINAQGIYYRQLNEQIHELIKRGVREVTLDNVKGQRYIGNGLNSGVRITINGVPGSDLAAFMNGSQLIVLDNAQDGVGNTMNAGKIVIHGDAGDVLGYAMRGGKIFVRGDVGYRAGIHMKAFKDQFPVVVIGGRARDYFGEYMAGGILVALNMHSPDKSPVGDYCGTGMHGGVIYLRGRVEKHQLGLEVVPEKIDDEEWEILVNVIQEFCQEFEIPSDQFPKHEFTKLTPQSTRPYGTLYAY
jgi:glutamate synthase domain-containing protein 3